MKRIITLTVLNRPGVLNRMTNLFSKRNYNIESITVGHAEQEGVARITCVVNVENDGTIEQITKQLNKQVDVLKVIDITEQSIVSRELALIKIPVTPNTRGEINALIEPFRATIVDVAKDSVVIQIIGESDKIEAFIELIRPYGIKELARTGTTSIARGSQRTNNQQKTYSIL